jgi:hypothetical protein
MLILMRLQARRRGVTIKHMATDEKEVGDLAKIRKYQYASTWPLILAITFLVALHVHLFAMERRSAIICAVFAFVALKTQMIYKHSLICPKCNQHFYGAYRLFMPYTRVCKGCGLDFRENFQYERRDIKAPPRG